MELREGEAGLALVADGMELRADFSRMLPRVRGNRLSRELLVRAARVRRGEIDVPRAIDATAGLGEDAFLLAAAGFEVTLHERDAVVAALLADGLRRAADDAAVREIVARMRLVATDSIGALCELARGGGSCEVVLLDPMFPAKRKDAAAKKKLQLIQRLERPCEDEADLLDAALGVRPRKVVVKRPLRGPHLAGRVPSHSLAGKVVRFDVYVPVPG